MYGPHLVLHDMMNGLQLHPSAAVLLFRAPLVKIVALNQRSRLVAVAILTKIHGVMLGLVRERLVLLTVVTNGLWFRANML